MKHRVQDRDCRLVVTADVYRQGKKTIDHKKKMDKALPDADPLLYKARCGHMIQEEMYRREVGAARLSPRR
ncbi:MAG: hypothetical protein ABIQ79_04960 [Nitrospiraceae bacterium]|nr:hypothetical protein [Nitrospiraceae bacterium]